MTFDMNAFDRRYAEECDLGTPRYALEYTGHAYSEHRDLVPSEDGDWVRADAYADLRAKLELFRGHVCSGCGCATAELFTNFGEVDSDDLCEDCYERMNVGACLSVGMRALCGRRIFDE